jgi:hypothetical protein
MKVFFTPVVNGEYQHAHKFAMPDTTDARAYEIAEKHFNGDKEYVSFRLDGEGSISMKLQCGLMTYVQEEVK